MNKKIISVLGPKFQQLLEYYHEELEQEILILKWKLPDLDDQTIKEMADRNILYREYKFFKYHNRLSPLSDKIEMQVKEDIITEKPGMFLLSTYASKFRSLSSYERYIVYLLSTNTKGEVSLLLNCSPSYLSKLLDKIKNKILKVSSSLP